MLKRMLPVFFLLLFKCSYGQFQELEGLAFESPDSIQVKNKNFFNDNNWIYQVGREFIFSYTIIKNGDTLLCRVTKRGDPVTGNWTFVRAVNKDSLTIRHISFKILEGYGGLDELFPDFSQTVIQQRYYSPNNTILFDGYSGLIDNTKNIWIHPFRGKFFSVTEFSPFPYIKLPIRKGRSWTWRLTGIDERWSDPRIIEYKGKQEATYEYKITGKTKLLTAFGYLECFHVESYAKSTLGSSALHAYFHPDYGFIKLRYTNIDKSVIEMNLVKLIKQ